LWDRRLAHAYTRTSQQTIAATIEAVRDSSPRRTAAKFQNEGGPIIVVMEVPDQIIARAVDEVYFPLSQGVVQFDEGAGLEELRAAWPTLPKQIFEVEDP
jgi:hypothetical protein